MADPILVNQIITSLGLTDTEANEKRAELEKLSNDELNKLLSQSKSFEETSLGGFSGFVNQTSQNVEVFKPQIIENNFEEFSSSKKSEKMYTSAEQKELDRFLGDFLFNSASSGVDTIESYNRSVGWLNITDSVVNGFKVLTGQEDRIDLQQRLTDEQKEAKKLKDTAYLRPSAFESQVERKFNVPYNHANVENLKTTSQEYTRVTAYHEKFEILKQGFSDVRTIRRKEVEYEVARKNIRGAAAASITPPEVSSHQKFGQVLFDFCNGDQNLVKKYMENLSSEIGSKTDIEKNIDKVMQELEHNCEAEYKKALGNKSYSQYESEYTTACKKVLGSKDSKETAKNFVENAKTQAAYTEIGLTIATSLLFPGSSAVKGGLQKVALKYGEKTAAQSFKVAMTF